MLGSLLCGFRMDLNDLHNFIFGEWSDEDADYEDIQCGTHSQTPLRAQSKDSAKR